MFNDKTFFLKEILENGRDLQLKASGLSMFPFIKYGDLVTIRAIKDSKPQIGQLLLFKKKDKLVLHRLIENRYDGEYVYITKGDCALHYDEPIKESQILGKAVKIKRKGKYINLESKKYNIFNYILSKVSFFRIFKLYWILLSLIGKIPEKEVK